MRKHPMNKFMRNSKSSHPSWIYNQNGNYYEYIGITHSNKSGKNIPLDVNPEPNNPSKAYLQPEPESSRKENFKQTYPDWAFDDADKAKVEAVKAKGVNYAKAKKKGNKK